MELSNIRLLVNDFDECFRFYSEKVGLHASWGKLGGDYASFDIGMPSGLSLYKSDLMAQAMGDSIEHLPENSREKAVIVVKVDNVDVAHKDLSARGVAFLNEPADMAGWGMRVAHFRDPEGNMLEIWSALPKEKWDSDLQSEAEEYSS